MNSQVSFVFPPEVGRGMSEKVPGCAGPTVGSESYIADIIFNFQLVGKTRQVKHTEKLASIYFTFFKLNKTLYFLSFSLARLSAEG